MRTNIVIDDQLMARVMADGEYKSKREAVEQGLRLLARRKAYAAIRAARGTFVWDDSDEGWAKVRAEELAEEAAENAAHEPAAPYSAGKLATKSKGGKR